MSLSEYRGPSVNSQPCSYGSLGCYGGNCPKGCKKGCGGDTVTIQDQRMAYESNVYITPTYDAIGYDALTHGNNGCCNNYFTLNKAYGNNCPGYNKRRCGGCYNGCGGDEIVNTMPYFPGPELGIPVSILPYPQPTEVGIDNDLINETSVIYTGVDNNVQTQFVPGANEILYNRGGRNLRAYKPHQNVFGYRR
jgi:hypothetical protein